MTKYTHYITVPVTGAVSISIETDEPIPDGDMDKAMELALEAFDKVGASFDLKVEREIDSCGVELAEGWNLHKHLNRGNVCHAETPETYWETEEHE